jgi:Protein of unknown function (DUF2939)
MNKRTLSAIAAAVVIVGIASSYASPYLTMQQMHSAMMEKDADAFSSNVDFPSVRESLQAQFMTVVQAQISNSPELKDNLFAGLGMMMAATMVNQMINNMVTPAGVMAMMAQDSARPVASAPASASHPASVGDSSQARSNADKVDYSVRYKNWSTFTATAKVADDAQIALVFKRHGLWSWKLASVNLPLDKLSRG